MFSIFNPLLVSLIIACGIVAILLNAVIIRNAFACFFIAISLKCRFISTFLIGFCLIINVFVTSRYAAILFLTKIFYCLISFLTLDSSLGRILSSKIKDLTMHLMFISFHLILAFFKVHYKQSTFS